jgi:ABC-type branched-subunit amino acid transport system substrate-binding protein
MGERQMSHRRAALALLLVLATLAAGCGSDRKDDESSTSTTAASSTTAVADGKFGDIESPCGKGDASGSPDQGVTDEAIKIGYGDDAGFPNSPGLNHEMSDAVKAFVSWCNDQGGINGRKVDATYYDAKITEVNNVMTAACSKEFFMVGQGFALDAGQEAIRRGCKLPSVPGFAVSPPFSNGPLKFEPFPIPADYTNVAAAAMLAKRYPEEIKQSATFYANYSATIDSTAKVVEGFSKFGFKFSCPQEYNIQGESDWKPFIQKLKSCGAKVVYFSGSPYPNFENALTAAEQLDYRPIWYVEANFYDEAFGKWNKDHFADKVFLRESYVPLFEADKNPATQQFLDIVKKSGGDVNQLGEQAASAFLLWATAAKACGSDLTRDCVLTEVGKVHDWTGGGLHAKADPGANLPSNCGFLMGLNGTEFVRVEPKEAGTYACDPSYAAKLTGPVVERAKLDTNRISQL